MSTDGRPPFRFGGSARVCQFVGNRQPRLSIIVLFQAIFEHSPLQIAWEIFVLHLFFCLKLLVDSQDQSTSFPLLTIVADTLVPPLPFET